MVPTPVNHSVRSTPRLIYGIASLIVNHGPKLVKRILGRADQDIVSTLAKREPEKHDAKFAVFATLIPVLVLLSGLFAGLTLGYMSLDETQLHVLTISGTPKQREYAKKIVPIRKNGHLLLVTLLLANMIVNETLPVISDPVLDGGAQSVVVSTVLIVIFAEIIPQSLCTRYGLAIGANMAWLVRILFYTVGIISWPVAKLLEFILGPHHGIMYRRGELKELIAMHATTGELGGDLKKDTVTIIGATLDLQEKVVKQAMTPIDEVFMLDINSRLDYETMKLVGDSGHSRVPIYEEIEVPLVSESLQPLDDNSGLPIKTQKVKKIIGILLVKQLLMLDPKDATPLRKVPLNRANFVPNNMPLLHILDRFQEGRSHMAIVSRYSEEKALSIKQQMKKGLTQRLMERVGIADSDSDTSGSDSDGDTVEDNSSTRGSTEGSGSEKGKDSKRRWRRNKHKKNSQSDVEKGELKEKEKTEAEAKAEQEAADKEKGLTVPHGVWSKLTYPGREQNLPDDAVLAKEDAKGFLRGFEPAVHPLGIITLEDVLEELIGEEIYDEFDLEGESQLKTYVSPKRGQSRSRDPSGNAPPLPVPEGPTTNTHSPPHASVMIAESPVSRTPSLAPSLNALATQKRNRGATPTPITTTARQIIRERSKKHGGSRPASVVITPASPVATSGPVLSESIQSAEKAAEASIPSSQERTGPDIGVKSEEERKGQE